MANDSDDDDDDDSKVADQLRPVQGFRSTEPKFREMDELDDAKVVLEALGLPTDTLRHRGRYQDPPDCEAMINGQLYGIESTEIAHAEKLGMSIRATQAGESRVWHHEWTRDEFLTTLRAKIARKDNPTKLKGGPYKPYILVLYTAEMHLEKIRLEEFLASETFDCSLIDEAYIVLDYHPPNGRPIVPITVRKMIQD